jgi:hypothetical protein
MAGLYRVVPGYVPLEGDERGLIVVAGQNHAE